MIDRIKSFFKSPTEPTRSILQEQAWIARSGLLGLMGDISRYNPDDLVARKGADIYARMMRDPQIKSAYDLRVNIVISRGWRFVLPNDDDIQVEMRDFFERMLSDWFRGTFIQAMRSILRAKMHGFSVCEKVYSVVDFEGQPRWIVKAIKPKPFDTFEFIADEYGNLETIIQRQQHTEEKRLDPNKFVVYINHPDIDPIWGESDLRSIYRAYWEKDVILKLRNIYLERHAGGFLVATPNENAQAMHPAELAAFENAIKNVQTMSAIRAPMGYQIDVKQAADTQAFDSAIAFSDRQITKGLLIPNLMGFTDDSRFGSRALGDTQLDVFMMTVQEEGERLADTLNEQVFAQLARWNYGTDQCPRFCLDGYTTAQKQAIAKLWMDAVKSGVVENTFEDELRTRELLMYGDREEDEDEEPETPEPQDQPEEPEEPAPGSEIEDPEEQEPSDDDIEAPAGAALAQHQCSGIPPATGQLAMSVPFSSRIDFAALDDKWTSVEEDYVLALSDAVDDVYADLKAGLETQVKDVKSGLDTTDAVERLQAVIRSATKDNLNKTIQKQLKSGYDLGRKEAQNVIVDAVAGQPKDIRDAVKIKAAVSQEKASGLQFVWIDGMPVDTWTVANFAEGLSLKAANDYIRGRAFQDTKGITDDMLKAATNILLQGIQEDWSVQEYIREFDQVMEPFIGTDNVSELTGKPKRARLETIARTTTASIFNQAQLSAYMDPGLGDFVEGFEYVAVLDNRVSDICESLSGRKYAKNDPIWAQITPPNHFQCRSMLEPILIIDDWKPSDKAGIVSPDKGFGTI